MWLKMVTFTREESRDIIIAVIALTILFSLSVTRPIGWSIENLLFYAPIAFVAVGIGFILHELGHKVVAQRFGFVSEFRRWDYGLILGFLTVPFGFMIFAPGAVYFGAYGRMVTNEENGKIKTNFQVAWDDIQTKWAIKEASNNEMIC